MWLWMFNLYAAITVVIRVVTSLHAPEREVSKSFSSQVDTELCAPLMSSCIQCIRLHADVNHPTGWIEGGREFKDWD